MADLLNDTLKNASLGDGKKPEATTEGMLIAYCSLIIMALLPIYFGSFRAIKYIKKQKESGEKLEVMSQKDAAMFPLYASVALLGLYIFFRLFSKEYVNLLLTIYFFGLGVLAMTHILCPVTKRLLSGYFEAEHNFVHTKAVGGVKEELVNFTFTYTDIIAFVISSVVGGFYLWKKPWILNNVFGLAFALNGVEILHINSLMIGCILLGGLFVYDIFWVFGTDVMVTVAKSFEAPIKLVFPQDLLENLFDSKNFAMLGLGDIVIPGIFIAMLLRFDKSLQRGNHVYFHISFLAYFAGLVTTIFILYYFKHAQPALLYLVPACIGAPLLTALCKGDLKALFKYQDHPMEEEEEQEAEVAAPGDGDGKKEQ